jgi:pimeloyl-ACP methyl ester carboxylesterase
MQRQCLSRRTLSLVHSIRRVPLIPQQQQQQRTIYQALPTDKKPKAEEAFPWRTFTIPSNYLSTYHNNDSSTASDLHVAAYNPLGKAVKPPNPIILIPGLTTNHRIFDSLARELNYPYGVVSYDLHSRGKSGKVSSVTNGHTLKQHVYDLMRVLKATHQSSAFLVGYGYGGLIAYLAMKLFPHRVNGLVLLDSGFPKTANVQQQANEEFQIPAHVLSGFLKELDVIAASDAKSANDIRDALFGSDSSKWANAVDVDGFAQYTFENRDPAALRDSVTADLQTLSQELLTIEELFKWRHPMAIVRAEKGFPFDTKSLPVLDEKTAKLLQQELNVKDKYVTLKGENHYSMLVGKQVAEVAKAIESLVSKYDVHHRVLSDFESLKEETPQQRRERLEKSKKTKQE